MSTSSSPSTGTSRPESSETDELAADLRDDEHEDSGARPLKLTVAVEHSGARLDVLTAQTPGLTRSQAAALIAAGRVTVDGQPVTRAAARIAAGAVVSVLLPSPEPIDAVPQDLPIDVVYEDRDVVVVNKAPGMVVHPAPGHPDGTLVNALLHRCGDLSGIGGAIRPGIVHRIDRDTSGLIVVTKNDAAHQALAEQFAAHTVERRYLALCVRLRGAGLDDEGRIETGHTRAPDDRRRFTGVLDSARRAITNYRVLERFADGAMLVQLRLETGRTHQIRMHMAERGCPLLGDPLYGGRAAAESPLIARTALHATSLGFALPGGDRVHLSVDPPADFADALLALRRGRSWRG